MASELVLTAPERSGFSARVRQSIIATATIWGIQREVFIGSLMAALLVVLVLPWPVSRVWRIVFVACLWLVVTGVGVYAAKREPQWPELAAYAVWQAVFHKDVLIG